MSYSRSYSRGNVLHSGYLFKEEQSTSFFGTKSIEKKRRFFILPRVRSTDKSTKLRLSYYIEPGNAVEKGCFFITPKSYVSDMSEEDTSDCASAASFGMCMFPTQGAEPVNLWTDSWQERELWKNAITEGVCLLAQKERVIRRDHRKKQKKCPFLCFCLLLPFFHSQ